MQLLVMHYNGTWMSTTGGKKRTFFSIKMIRLCWEEIEQAFPLNCECGRQIFKCKWTCNYHLKVWKCEDAHPCEHQAVIAKCKSSISSPRKGEQCLFLSCISCMSIAVWEFLCLQLVRQRNWSIVCSALHPDQPRLQPAIPCSHSLGLCASFLILTQLHSSLPRESPKLYL